MIIRQALGRAEAILELERLKQRTNFDSQRKAQVAVDSIIERVRIEGDAALIDLTEHFDGFRPETLLVPEEEIAAAWQACPASLQQALKLAHQRILDFHQRQLPNNLVVNGSHGEKLSRRWRPVKNAGLYIPGGRASYPSTVLMNAVPARVAGVDRLVIATPAGPDGHVNSAVLAAAHLVGIHEVVRVGGAQAIAALAHGTESVPQVDVVSGPGNLYVTLAKKAVYGIVGIDSLAGPSEVLIIADHTALADQVASDLLAQAEHDPLASSILLTVNSKLVSALPDCLESQLRGHPRETVCRKSLRDWGLIVSCDSLEDCAYLSDIFAPEHLELLIEDPHLLVDRIQHAGAIFIGPWTPEAVGDYLAGPSHILPTCGTARYSSALCVETFLHHTSLIEFNRTALKATGDSVSVLANSEGLYSHAHSVQIRLDSL